MGTRCRQRICNTDTKWREKACLGRKLRRSGSQNSFPGASVSPTMCRGALVGAGLPGLHLSPLHRPRHSRGQWPRVASGENAAGAQPCRPRRAGRSHSPPLAAIFTCPVSKRDATRRRHPSPPPLPSRGSSWPNPRLWLPPFSSYAAAATAKAKVSAFPALRRRHVRKPAVRHRVQWAEVGRGGGRRRAGA